MTLREAADRHALLFAGILIIAGVAWQATAVLQEEQLPPGLPEVVLQGRAMAELAVLRRNVAEQELYLAAMRKGEALTREEYVDALGQWYALNELATGRVLDGADPTDPETRLWTVGE